jgi:ABC-2 type transport system permease protein
MFPVLFGKEVLESWRSYRSLVLVIVLVAFGILSPAAARFAPELIKLAAGDQADVGALLALMPAPTKLDSVDQYLKNLTQMGILVMILMTMGLVAREKETGTAALVLARPVSRTAFLLAKFSVLAGMLTVALGAAGLTCFLYTRLLFGEWLNAAMFAAVNGLMWLYLLIPSALTFLASSLMRSGVAAAGLGLGAWAAVGLLGSIGCLKELAPGRLVSASVEISRGAAFGAWTAIVTSLGLILLCLSVAAVAFARQEL